MGFIRKHLSADGLLCAAEIPEIPSDVASGKLSSLTFGEKSEEMSTELYKEPSILTGSKDDSRSPVFLANSPGIAVCAVRQSFRQEDLLGMCAVEF